MFQGSKHVPGDTHFKLLEGAGAQRHQRHHRLRSHQLLRDACPSNQLELALWLESDRMGYLLDKLDQAKLVEPAGRRPQRAAAERREPALRHRRRGGVPPALSARTIRTTRNVIGSHADIQAAKLDDVQNFFKQYYAPNNASLAIVGDFDKAAGEAAGREVFRHR